MRKLLIPGVFIATLLNGCGSVDKLPFVHRIDVQQGNVITQENIDQLKPGMTKRQVRFTLGSPMIADTFHPDRWDYVYRMEPGKGEIEQKRVSLRFKDDALIGIEGDYRPTPQPALAAASKPSTTVVVPPQERKEAGILTRIWQWLGFGKDEI
ncbi:MAG: outer membrane protein assembly factor BamE [Gammaproteobacteria bacterium]|nr:outer membrane protein assembly factor BamE [Gammaproteobacteria bacterium]